MVAYLTDTHARSLARTPLAVVAELVDDERLTLEAGR